MNPIRVLLIEDDPGDVELTREALSECKLTIELEVIEDGAIAIERLKNGKNGAKPDLIFLDLNLPKKDGREVLSEIKANKESSSIPVVVLTTSNSDEDILKSYTCGANCYVTKPVGLDQFTKVIKSIEDFWFTVVKLPPR